LVLRKRLAPRRKWDPGFALGLYGDFGRELVSLIARANPAESFPDEVFARRENEHLQFQKVWLPIAVYKETRKAIKEIGPTLLRSYLADSENRRQFKVKFNDLIVETARRTEEALRSEAQPATTTRERADESIRAGPEPVVDAPSADGTGRRAAVDAYIEEVFRRTGKHITRKDIWRHARYKTRTEFERWERNDAKRPNKTAHKRFTRILTEKPHLK
jgi:hypothetical protein